MNQLQQAELLEVEEIEHERFEITDINSLNWVFRKISALKTKRNEVDELLNAEIQRLKDWAAAEVKPIDNSLEYFESLVQRYHAKQLADNPKAKTLSTPFGKSKTRRSKEQPEKANEEAVLQYAIENGMDDYIKNSVRWNELKKTLKIVDISGEKYAVDENGQIVPGVTIKPESVSFSVEV